MGIYLTAIVPIKSFLLLVAAVGQTYLLASEKSLSSELTGDIVSATKVAAGLATALAVLGLVAGAQLFRREAGSKLLCVTYFAAAPFVNLTGLVLLAGDYTSRESEFVHRSVIAGVAWFLLAGFLSLIAVAYLHYARSVRGYLGRSMSRA